MQDLEAIRARHAVRSYTKKPIIPAIIAGLKEEIEQCDRLEQLHIQLVTENEEFVRLTHWTKSNYILAWLFLGEKNNINKGVVG